MFDSLFYLWVKFIVCSAQSEGSMYIVTVTKVKLNLLLLYCDEMPTSVLCKKTDQKRRMEPWSLCDRNESFFLPSSSYNQASILPFLVPLKGIVL